MVDFKASLPKFKDHQTLLRYDLKHGMRAPLLGEHFHWLRSGLFRKQRQVFYTPVLLVGNNPWLGSLIALGLSRQHVSCIWVYAEQKDRWDYPLLSKGFHQESFKGLKDEQWLAQWERGQQQNETVHFKMAWDYQIQDRFENAVFLEPACMEVLAEAQNNWAGKLRRQGSLWPQLKIDKQPRRFGGHDRIPVVFFDRLIYVSDPKDGMGWNKTAEGHLALPDETLRLGSARWQTGNALTFAQWALEDTKIALKEGGWA